MAEFLKKICKQCGRKFFVKGRGFTKKMYCNIECKTLHYQKHNESGQRSWYKRRYGLTLEQYNELADEQNHRCAICGSRNKATRRKGFMRLCVDHDHKTKKVRGLLCNLCNRAIGQLQDDPRLLRKAIQYLVRNQ